MSYIEENISNFEKGYKFYQQKFTLSELYQLLKTGDILEKQLACVQIDVCETPEQAEILLDNLTGVDGKIREVVSFKLKSFIQTSSQLFHTQKFYDIFLDAIIDINANICRNVIVGIKPLVVYDDFSNYFVEKIFERVDVCLKTLGDFDVQERKYVINKENFKLYWYLETLFVFDNLPTDNLFELMKSCARVEEYTIREKTAQLIVKLPPSMRDSFDELNYDNNFYVKLASKF